VGSGAGSSGTPSARRSYGTISRWISTRETEVEATADHEIVFGLIAESDVCWWNREATRSSKSAIIFRWVRPNRSVAFSQLQRMIRE
jgi:hypothetical protein